MSKPTPKRKTPKPAIIHLNDPERVAKIQAVFTSRGGGDLPVSAQMRTVIEEWLGFQAIATDLGTVFAGRGLGELPVPVQIRIAVREWLAGQSREP